MPPPSLLVWTLHWIYDKHREAKRSVDTFGYLGAFLRSILVIRETHDTQASIASAREFYTDRTNITKCWYLPFSYEITTSRFRIAYETTEKPLCNLGTISSLIYDKSFKNFDCLVGRDEKLLLQFLLHLKSAQHCRRRPLYYLWQGTRNSSRVINFLKFLLK